MIVSKTPFRVSLFGGGTDFPEYYNKHGGEVIGGSINKYCYITLRNLHKIQDFKYEVHYSKIERVNKINDIEHPVIKACYKIYKIKPFINLIYDADMPAKSGLGTSSSFTVGLINAINKYSNRKISKKELLRQSIHLEKNYLKESVGCQDQTFATYGGLNHVKFCKNKILVKKININHNLKKTLESNFFLVFTNNPRFASKIEKNKILNIKNNLKVFDKIKNLTSLALKNLESKNDPDEIGLLLNEYWHYKKELSKQVSHKLINDIYQYGIEGGANGGKILGAGGGGFLLFYCCKKNQKKFLKKMNKFAITKFKFTDNASRIIHHS